MRAKLFVLLTTACVFMSANLQGQKLFKDDTPLELTLVCSLDSLLRDRYLEPTYHKATLSGFHANGSPYSLNIRVRTRGNFRRNDETCKYPPMLLRFSKKDVAGPFEGGAKIKLVTPCAEDRYVLREYYLYKMWQLISPYALKVRLCIMTYVDEDNTLQPETHYGFLIDDIENYAESLGGVEADTTGYDVEKIHREQLTLVYLFQYMIGNPDYEMERLKNIHLIEFQDGRAALPVPRDFDWSGAVDAPYTKPQMAVPNMSFFEKRKFRPLCRTQEEFEEGINKLKSIMPELSRTIESSELLDTADKAYMLSYFQDFFKIANKPAKVRSIFVESCKGPVTRSY